MYGARWQDLHQNILRVVPDEVVRFNCNVTNVVAGENGGVALEVSAVAMAHGAFERLKFRMGGSSRMAAVWRETC